MAYTYIIDGYNLLYAMENMPAGRWEERRESLVRWLSIDKPQGRNAAWVVFDSRQGYGERQRWGEIGVIYTSGQSADEWIADKVRTAKNPRCLVVVTNDKGIRTMVRGTGARWVSASEFIADKPAREPVRPVKKVVDEEVITNELTKRWL